MNPIRVVKRLARMAFSRSSGFWWWRNRLPRDYWRAVGDGTHSSTVMAPVQWVATTFPEAPPMLWRKQQNGQEEYERDHPLLRLLEQPNEFYSGEILWMATTTDWMVDGNAYWIKIRSAAGTPVQLWYVPHWMIEPKGDDADDGVFISHYEYRVNAETRAIAPSEVVHFRFGLDSENPRKGRSRLHSVLSEIFTDDEAARFTATILHNMGVPGLVVSPETGDYKPTDVEVEETKAYLRTQFSDDKRGEPLVMSGPTKIAQFGFSPEQLMLRELRRIPEERVTAALGVPAIVAGLGAGLDRSTFTNMGEAREAAYESGIIPMQRLIAADIRHQLLTDFEGADGVFQYRFGFDLTKVRVLQEDLYRQAQRHDLMIRGGWEMRSEGRRALGLEVDDDRDNVFLRQVNVVEVPADGGPPRQPAPPANGNGNGNGRGNGYDPAAASAIADEVVRAIERDRLARA